MSAAPFQKLRPARLRRGLSLRQMARLLGYSATHLQHIEIGRQAIPVRNRAQIRGQYRVWLPRTTEEQRDLLLVTGRDLVKASSKTRIKPDSDFGVMLAVFKKALKEIEGEMEVANVL